MSINKNHEDDDELTSHQKKKLDKYIDKLQELVDSVKIETSHKDFSKLEIKLDILTEKQNNLHTSVELVKQNIQGLTRETRELKEEQKKQNGSHGEVTSHISQIKEIGGKDLSELRDAVSTMRNIRKYFTVMIIAALGSVAKTFIEWFW